MIKVEEINSNLLINFMLEKCSSKKIYYVHNLTFEMFVFIKYLMDEKIKFKMISANKTIYSAEIFYKKKIIKLRCSYRLTMLPLSKLAELADIKEKSIFPYTILNNELKENISIEENMFKDKLEYSNFAKIYGLQINTFKILEEYCKNDALITKNSIIKYWQIILESGFKKKKNILTAAKLSITNFFQNNIIIKQKIKLKYDRILRKDYFGGRTEVFGNPLDDEILLHYDWSGMYAQCMCENVLGGEIFDSNIITDISNPGFYWIQFEQNLEIPVLPIKKNKLLFANGTFEGWYWFEEIILAIENGVKIKKIKKTISAQYYDKFIKNFVEINNKIREISPLHKQIGKNNNNTFYGRLGMNPEKEEEEITNIIENKKYIRTIEQNGIYIGYSKKEKSISNILISASITSKARIKLYRGMKEIIKNGGRILYTDTDSIIASFKKNRYEKVLNVKLGEIFFDKNKEDTIIIDGVFAMPKTYAIKYINNSEIVKIKGFNTKPTFTEFKEKFYKKENIITENTEWNKKDFQIKFIKKEKETNLNQLDKRIWDHTLKFTYPIQM